MYLFNDEYNYFEPDLTVVCDLEKLDDKGCHGAPDWVIEITSPITRQMDYMVKLFKYERAGVKEYWIVDLEKEHVRVYDFYHSTTEDYNLDESVKVGIYEDLKIDFREITKAIE